MRLTALSFCLALIAVVSACGIKPGELDPPPGVQRDSFPKTYPSTVTP